MAAWLRSGWELKPVLILARSLVWPRFCRPDATPCKPAMNRWIDFEGIDGSGKALMFNHPEARHRRGVEELIRRLTSDTAAAVGSKSQRR